MKMWLEVGQADRRAHQLTLGALRAVEEQAFASAPDEQRGGRASRCGRAAGGAEKHEVEIHEPAILAERALCRRST